MINKYTITIDDLIIGRLMQVFNVNTPEDVFRRLVSLGEFCGELENSGDKLCVDEEDSFELPTIPRNDTALFRVSLAVSEICLALMSLEVRNKRSSGSISEKGVTIDKFVSKEYMWSRIVEHSMNHQMAVLSSNLTLNAEAIWNTFVEIFRLNQFELGGISFVQNDGYEAIYRA